MSRTYRVLRHQETDDQGEQFEWFAIHEVYIGDTGLPQSCSKDPAVARGDTIGQLADRLRAMLEALEDATLDYDDLGP